MLWLENLGNTLVGSGAKKFALGPSQDRQLDLYDLFYRVCLVRMVLTPEWVCTLQTHHNFVAIFWVLETTHASAMTACSGIVTHLLTAFDILLGGLAVFLPEGLWKWVVTV